MSGIETDREKLDRLKCELDALFEESRTHKKLNRSPTSKFDFDLYGDDSPEWLELQEQVEQYSRDIQAQSDKIIAKSREFQAQWVKVHNTEQGD